MLTLQALKYPEDPEYELAGPFGTMPQEPDNLWGFTLQGSAHDLPGSTLQVSASHTEKSEPLQAENSQNRESFNQQEKYFPS